MRLQELRETLDAALIRLEKAEADRDTLERVMRAIPGTREYDASWEALSESVRARLAAPGTSAVDGRGEEG